MGEQGQAGDGQIKTGSELLAIMTGKVKRRWHFILLTCCSTGGARRMRSKGCDARHRKVSKWSGSARIGCSRLHFGHVIRGEARGATVWRCFDR
jgi:hypothetical protein